METCLWLLTSIMKNDLCPSLEVAEASAPVHAVVECSNQSTPGALTNIAQVVLSISGP